MTTSTTGVRIENEALVLAYLSTLSTGFVFAYEWGFCLRFGIPPSQITFGPSTVFAAVSVALPVLFLLLLLSGLAYLACVALRQFHPLAESIGGIFLMVVIAAVVTKFMFGADVGRVFESAGGFLLVFVLIALVVALVYGLKLAWIKFFVPIGRRDGALREWRQKFEGWNKSL